MLYTLLAYLRPHEIAGGAAVSMRLSLLVLIAMGLGTVWAVASGRERPRLKA